MITYHESWSYFAGRFGLRVADELEPKPGVPPGPGHLQEIITKIRKENIRVILHENIYKDDAARFVAGKTGVSVVIAPISVGGVKEADDYFSLMDHIVKLLAGGFAS